MGFKILAINPGSTSTKVALYDEERPSLDLTLRHTAEQIARYTNIIDQLGWRREMILTALSEHGFDIMQLSAVIGRGGLVRPIPAGVYEVNEAMRRDLTNATMEHASNSAGYWPPRSPPWRVSKPTSPTRWSSTRWRMWHA